MKEEVAEVQRLWGGSAVVGEVHGSNADKAHVILGFN
jgi:hypothetical protein